MFTTFIIIASLILFISSVANLFYFSQKNLPFSSNIAYALFILNFFGAIVSLFGVVYGAFRINFLEREVHKLDTWVDTCGSDKKCVDNVLSRYMAKKNR
jgi:hypothetical protein